MSDSSCSKEEIHVNLISAEGKEFSVPIKVAQISNFVKNIISNIDEDIEEAEESYTDVDITCLNVSTDVLQKVVDFCTHYVNVEEMNEISTTPFLNLRNKKSGEQILVRDVVNQDWYADFCYEELGMLKSLMAAAAYMDIKPLVDLIAVAVSVATVGMTGDELRSTVVRLKCLNFSEPIKVKEENK